MAAVDAAPDALAALLEGGGVVAANLNSPRQTVLSGPQEHVEAAVEWCRERGVGARMLPVACAFHSPHVAGAQQRFAQLLERTSLAVPRVPVYSNTSGDAHEQDTAAIAALLSEHLIRPVEFVREIDAMYRDGARIFVEVGPRSVLAGLVPQILGEREHLAVPMDRPGRSGLLSLLHCLAALAAEGLPVQTDRLFSGRPAARVDPRGNGHAAEEPGATWLVDGGRAWPAGTTREPAAPIPVAEQEEHRAVTNTSTNGGGPLVPASLPEQFETSNGHPDRSPPAAASHAWPPAGGEISAPPAAGDRVAEVMLRHQQVMQQFLEAQSSVMLGYLGAARGAAALPGVALSRPAIAPVRPAAAALPAAPAPAAPVQPATPPPAAAPAPAAPGAVAPAPAPAAAAAATTAPAEEATGVAATMTREQLQERLLAVVSERTGYPAEMLALDADLEGDLGIDSIKRVEIAGTLTQGLGLEERAAIDLEELTASRTLTAVIDILEAALGGSGTTATAAPPGAQAGAQRPFERGAGRRGAHRPVRRADCKALQRSSTPLASTARAPW